jgi:hypothetical protein
VIVVRDDIGMKPRLTSRSCIREAAAEPVAWLAFIFIGQAPHDKILSTIVMKGGTTR